MNINRRQFLNATATTATTTVPEYFIPFADGQFPAGKYMVSCSVKKHGEDQFSILSRAVVLPMRMELPVGILVSKGDVVKNVQVEEISPPPATPYIAI